MSREDRGDTPSVCLQGTPFRQGGPNQYHTETDGGAVTITEYNVFPGIWLAFHEIRALSFSPRRITRRGCWRSLTVRGAGWNTRRGTDASSWG